MPNAAVENQRNQRTNAGRSKTRTIYNSVAVIMNVDVSSSVLSSHACFTALATLEHVENGKHVHIIL